MIIYDSRIQRFVDKAKGTKDSETISVIIWVEPSPSLPLPIEKLKEEDRPSHASQLLPEPAADMIATGEQKYPSHERHTAARQKKLCAFKQVLKKLGLMQQARCNTLTGTVALDATAEQLKELSRCKVRGLIVENRHHSL